MYQPISRKQHGIADAAYVPTVFAAPRLAHFDDDDAPALAARIFAGTALAYSFFTKAEWGVVKVIPYKAHLVLDAIAGVGALAAPWMFGFAKDTRARNTFLAMGLTSLAVTAMSRPEEMTAGR